MIRKTPGTSKWLLRLIMFLFISGMIAGAAAYFVLSAWIQNYLRSDALRGILQRQLGNLANAPCEIEPISWSGWTAYSAKVSLRPERSAGWRRIEAESVQASLDWSSVRRGVWHVPGINLDRLLVTMGEEVLISSPPGDSDSGGDAPAWIRRWLPDRTEIGNVDVRKFELRPATGAGVGLDAIHLLARPAAEEGTWSINGDGGRVSVPGMPEPFRLGSATARIDRNAFVLNDAVAHWLGESEVTAHGTIPSSTEGGWIFSGRLAGLDLRHLLSSAWSPKISGVVDGDYEVSGRAGAAALSKAKFRVRSGVVQGLPVLSDLARYTGIDRFNRVVLDESSADLEVRGARTNITNLILQSNGLIRLEGDLSIDGRAIQGNILVGISPETLKWSQGRWVQNTVKSAATLVFTEGNIGKVPGFVWARMQITGTLDSPREDLSSRLKLAMGEAALIEAPRELLGVGAAVIGNPGEAAVEGGKAVIEGSREILKGTSEAADKGLEVLKSFIPLIPK